jgi:hypothetical protein
LVLYLPIGVIRIVNPKVFSKILSDPKLLGLKRDLNHYKRLWNNMNKYDLKKKKKKTPKLATWLVELMGVHEDLNGSNIKEILKQVNNLSYLLLALYPRCKLGTIQR